MASDLRDEETSLHAGMPPHRQAVLKPKRIKVFEAMLKETGYPDANLPKEISDGFKRCVQARL